MEFIKEVKPESVLIACLFIFPGFITIKISRLIHVQKDSPLAELIVDAAFYTIINYIVNSFLILYFFETQTTTLCKIIIAIWTLILFPAFLPFISSFLLKTQFIRRFTNVDPIPKPWDYYFAQKRSAWIIIHLKNGKKLVAIMEINHSLLLTLMMSNSIWKRSGEFQRKEASKRKLINQTV